MKLLMLGCGTSMGVPRIGNEWGLCDPEEPRNRRTRASVLIENAAGQRLLIDTSTDLRQQMLANQIDRIDAVFWTHDHADHVHGIDDLRPFRYGRGGPVQGYASTETARRLRQRFDYVFSGQHGYHTLVELETLERLRICCGFSVRHCQMPHGPAQSTAFRFESDGKSVAYMTDFSAISEEMIDLGYKVDLLVVDCLRREPHPTHAHLAMSLELVAASRAKQAVLTHLDKSMDFAAVSAEIPANVLVGFDGMVVQP